MKTPSTPKQQRYARLLIQQTGQLEMHVCQDATGNRASDVTQLTTAEANALIKSLLAQLKVEPDPDDVMRKKMLHFAHEMGWKFTTGQVDVKRVDAWCQQYGQFHKPLMEHNSAQLASVVTQFENVYRTFLRDLRK